MIDQAAGIQRTGAIGSARDRWGLLILATLTNTLVVAAPAMCMPVLFAAISAELGLDLVQVGLIWGISALPGIFTALAGGALSDRFGSSRMLFAACLSIGVFGALRGLANSFASLAAAMFLLGVMTPLVTMNTLKICGSRFPRRQLGLASGVLSMGMALGFLIGSMLSATVLAPWLGGWRPVLFFYGGIALLLCLPWVFLRPAANPGAAAAPTSLRQAMTRVLRLRNVWLLGLALLGIGGCIQGALGYIPLYLRGQGWAAARADGALAAFHTISMIFAIPIAIASDRLGMRKKVLLAAGGMISLGVGLLSVASGSLVWVAVCLAGMVRDGFMAVFMASVVETEGVGAANAGTAIGVVMVLSGLGNLLAPPLGNSLERFGPGLPFVFWAGLALLGLLCVSATKESSRG